MEDMEARVRALEIRQEASDRRLEDVIVPLLESNTKALAENTAATNAIAADFVVVRDWVQNWTALSKVATLVGKIGKPLMKFTAWGSGIAGTVAAAYIAWKSK